jgi:hypothetical protein
MKIQTGFLSRNQGTTDTAGPSLPHTGIDPIHEPLLSVCGLASVITNIESKQEQQYKDIQKLKEEQEKPHYLEHYGTPNGKIAENTCSNKEEDKKKIQSIKARCFFGGKIRPRLNNLGK